MTEFTLETITALAKRRGFVYQTSEIYGGLASSYDYGPLGIELLRNIKNKWWQEMIRKRADMIGLDSQILLHPQTWVASGHVASFTDPLVEDKVTHKRYHADHLIEAWLAKQPDPPELIVEALSVAQMGEFIAEKKILSPDGNHVTEPKEFNILFETAVGAIEGAKSKVYLRGETAQGIFTNFRQVLDSTRVKLPFGIGQIGKSFRNEITTGQFVFRTLEFEQAEIEYFFDPEQTDWQELLQQWQQHMWDFVVHTLGVREENLRWRRHSDKERSHYSRETYDLDYRFPFGFKELWGVAYRTDYDLQQHIQHSGAKLSYKDPFTGKQFVPHVIEPAVGINRLFLMLLCDAYWHDAENKRTVLRFNPELAPYKTAVFPLLRNKPDLVQKAQAVYEMVAPHHATTWDDRGNIGKRYYYQDEIGTPFCITIDFETLETNSVTVRHRDTTQQTRVNIGQLLSYLQDQL
ncbi:glycine--tRNA ligase [Candidatus Leptofilum sp.]|uniref:glycine--tRNA ligase n=1 Tax=Candidatus Leptofilum sp. TaxID=3241576 RepID=UPI003B5C714A